MALWRGSAESNVPDTRGNLPREHGVRRGLEWWTEAEALRDLTC
jgi:hypothetical protein